MVFTSVIIIAGQARQELAVCMIPSKVSFALSFIFAVVTYIIGSVWRWSAPGRICSGEWSED